MWTERNGSIRHKAHLVIKGYMQSNWGETYAPVGKLASFRYLASLAAGLGLAIDHMDVVTASLNPEVDDPDLMMEIPEGRDSGDVSGSGTGLAADSIVRLNKALYGLKQAPQLWYKDIDGFLVQSLDFTQSNADPNLYIHGQGDIRVLLLLYVDDMSIAYPSKAAAIAKEIKRKLAEKYKVTNLGTTKQFLGIEINSEINSETSKQISLGQKAYITSVLKRFDMENAYGTATSMATHIKPNETEKLGAREFFVLF